MRLRLSFTCCVVLAFLGGLPLASAEIPIDGRIRDSGGSGLAGVRVELRPILSSYEQGLLDLDGRSVEPVARTVTGADGRFQVSAPGEGMWEVGVWAEGFVPLRYRLTPLLGPETLRSVRMRRDVGLRVRVEGPDGQPLSGARVVGRTWSDEWPGWQTVPRFASSGADGVARLAASRDESVLLLATAPGFPVQEGPEVRGPAEVSFRLAAGTPLKIEAPGGALLRDLQTSLVLGKGPGEVVVRGESWLLLETADGVRVRFPVRNRIEVPAPRVLPGRVIDTATRQPVAGAWVWVRDDPGRFVRTDGQGVYRIHAEGDLEISAAGHLREVVDGSIPRSEGALPTVALDPEAVLAGTVVDREGRPAAGAEVVVFAKIDPWFSISAERSPARTGRVSAAGEVRIAGLRRGVIHHVVVTGPGFAPAWLADGELTARESRFRLVLSRGGRVSGRIEDAQGRPVPDAEVTIETAAGIERPILDDPAEEHERFTETGPDGGFAFADAPPGWYEMTVRRPGAAAQRLARFEVRDGGGAVDLGPLRLAAAEVLTARVTDPGGRPVAGAEVWLSSPTAEDWFGSWRRWPAAVSGPDGGFSLQASRWQDLELTVCAPGFVPVGLDLREIFPDEPLAVTVRPGASLSGRVTGADGLPAVRDYLSASLIGSSEVKVVQPCEGDGWGETDEAGRFRITGLEPGLYEIGYRDRLALAAGESRELAFQRAPEEPRTGSLSGKLMGSDGLPVPGAQVSLSALESHGGGLFRSHGASSRTDADGNYRLSFARPGLKIDESSLGVSWHGRTIVWSGFSDWPGPETVEAEGRFDIALPGYPKPAEAVAEVRWVETRREPAPVATLAGRILGLEPEELARVKVKAGPFWDRSVWTVGVVDPRGSYRLEGLLAGEGWWWIRAEAGDRTAFDSLYLPVGEAGINRDLVFEPVGLVAGDVRSSSDGPVAGAVVTFRHGAEPFDLQRPVAAARTRSDGSYSIRLGVGEYEVRAEHEGFAVDHELFEIARVEAGETDSVDLWLHPAVELRGRLRGLPPDEDVEITAVRVDGARRSLEGKMVAEDRYAIPGLGPGTWEVEAKAGKLTASGRVEIPEKATEAELHLAFARK